MRDISNSDFVHLHVHTDKSLLDGVASVEELIKKAAQCNHRALAITDHGNLHGIVSFAEAASSHNIKPIIGCEFYYQNKDTERTSHHITIFAKDNEGLINLYKLSTYSYLNGFYYKPRINKKILFENSKGLIVTTGCISSHINSLILAGDENSLKLAENEFRDFLEVFKEDFYIEIQDHGLAKQRAVNKVLLEWSRKYNVKIIAANDVHYVEKEDAQVQDIILAINEKTNIHDKTRFRILNDSNNILDQMYYKSTSEMLSIPIFAEHSESLRNTVEVSEKCNVSIGKGSSLYPSLYKDAASIIRERAYSFLSKKYGEIPQEISDRIEYELSVIEKLGYSSYFIIVSDIVSHARKSGILIGPGRGSAAGSLIAYALGITAINPIQYGLLFERFLNPERVSPPDIDVDFQHDKREEVIKYIENTYGEDKVAKIITFSTLQLRNAVRDVLRAYGVKPEDIDKVSKQIDNKKHGIEELEIILRESKVLSDKQIPIVSRVVSRLVDKTRHTGIHPSGIVVAPCPLENIVPLSVVSDELSKKKIKVTQFDMRDVEKMGLLKIDVLGLSTLTIIKKCIEDSIANLDIEKLYDLDTGDQEVYNIFSNGFTKGIFQFEGEGITSYLMKLKPNSINDLIALNALYRPGPFQYIDTYINRKHGKEKATYLHPSLESILSETYGIIIYQEQIMQIAQKLAGFTMAQADEFRRGIGKKETEKILKNKEKFIEGCIRNNISRDTAEKIFEDIFRFAEYGFNKSHAAAYAYLAYITAYLKKEYPLQFYAALLNDYINDHDKVMEIFYEMRMRKLPFRHPDINLSEEYFHVKNGEVVAGLCAIKNVRTDSIQKIIENRRKNGEFKSLADFLNRIKVLGIDKKTYEALLLGGALNNLIENSEYTLSTLAHPDNLEKTTEYITPKQTSKAKAAEITSSLFNLDDFEMFIQRNKKIDFINKQSSLSSNELMKSRAAFYALSLPAEIYDKLAHLIRNVDSSEFFVAYCADANTKIGKNKKPYYEYKLWGIDSAIFAYSSQKFVESKVACLVECEKNEDRYFVKNMIECNLDDIKGIQSIIEKHKARIKKQVNSDESRTNNSKVQIKASGNGHAHEAHESNEKMLRTKTEKVERGTGCQYEDIDKIEEDEMRLIYILDRIVLYDNYFHELKSELETQIEVDEGLVLGLSISRGVDLLKKYGYNKNSLLDEMNYLIGYYVQRNNSEVVRRLSTFKAYLEKYF